MTRRPWGYFDTSAAVKRYVREEGSAAAARALRRLRPLASTLMAVEAQAAFRRRHRAGELTDAAVEAIGRRFAADRGYWEWIEVSQPVLARAEALVREHDVRTLDALHLASLLVFREETRVPVALVTADVGQRAIAAALGIQQQWVGAGGGRWRGHGGP